MNREPAHSISKRGRVGEGRPTKRTPEVVAKIAEAIAIGLTDEEAGLLAGINPDTMTEWRKDPEFSGAIKKATAERLLMRLEREDSGWLRDTNGGRGVLVTSGFCRVLSEAHNRVVEKVKKDPDYLNRLRDKFKTWTL